MGISSVLVTGSSGTIGTALCESLLAEGYDVVGTDVEPNTWSEAVDEHTIVSDLRDPSTSDELPASVDLVVHLAANARVHTLVENPRLAKENLDTTFNCLEYAREVGADVLFASSREVYGDGDDLVYREGDTSVDDAHNPYTASKVGGEALVRSFESCYGVDASILRFSNVYGKYDASNRVIPLFIAKATRGEDLTVYGDEKVLDFTYIDDAIDGLTGAIRQFPKASSATFNVGSGRGTSLFELAEVIVEETEADVSVDIEENRTGEVSRFVADVSRAHRVLGYEPTYDLREGLARTINWYQSRPELFDAILENGT